MSNIDRAMAFVLEADRLKSVERANVLTDDSRPENTAEHSWHLALAALVFAPHAPPGCDVDRTLAMALIHDLPEIDAGDMPIDRPHDADTLRAAEDAGAARLFGLLPEADAARLHALRDAFEAGSGPDARFARRLDHLMPVLQVLWNPDPPADHRRICRENLATGRAAALAREWPAAHAHCCALQNGDAPPDGLARECAFLAEADRLKSVIRATRLADGARFENSAEHSWQLALMALVLPPPPGADRARAIRMLVLHDLVEIDAGDAPLFGAVDEGARARDEARAADRLFGMFPGGAALRTLWDEFEADDTPTARWSKSLDRFAPPNLNLANGGGSWTDYDVTEAQIRARVGTRIARGAPDLWDWLSPRVAAHFAGRD